MSAGDDVELAGIIDVQEMGAPEGLMGQVESISACPAVEGGVGRVVLTTVSHLSDDVYTLTLRDGTGGQATLGVTGSHRFYDELTGWTATENLQEGDILRGVSGDLTVLSVSADPELSRVYNFTVEADHVYYVGDLSTLTHNSCKDARELRKNLEAAGSRAAVGDEAAHLVPTGAFSSRKTAGLIAEMQGWMKSAGIGLNDPRNGFFTSNRNHNGTHTDEFFRKLHAEMKDGDIEGALSKFKSLYK